MTILMALLGLLTLVVGIFVFVLRRRGQRIVPTTEQEKTNEALRIAFGKDMKWGSPGATESEMHDHVSHSDHSGHDSSSDSGGGEGD